MIKLFIFSIFIVALTSACDVPSLFGKRKNEGSVTTASCSSNEFGPVPFAQPLSGKKVLLHRENFTTLSEVQLSEKDNLFALVDLKCAKSIGLKKASTEILQMAVDIRQQRIENLKVPYNISKINLKKPLSLRALENIANNDNCIKYVEEDFDLELYAVPNDAQYSSSHHLATLNMPTVWDFFYDPTNGISQTVVVAVIDSGGDVDHPDLDANKWINTDEIAGNLTDDDGNGYIDDRHGYNFVSNIGDPNPQGGNTHGTYVSGIVAARHNNAIGTAGVMGQFIQIMHLNASGPAASVSNSAANAAILYAVNNGANVVNMSFGAPQDSPIMRANLEAAVAANVVLVAAVGNAGQQLTQTNLAVPASYAAALDGLISVGAIMSDDNSYAYFSNYSSYYVEIMAAGGESLSSGIFTTTPGTDPANSYSRQFGTSMSAPVVAGAASLIVGYFKTHAVSYTAADIEEIIKMTAETNTSLNGKVQGCRMLNMINLSESLDE